MQESTEDHPRKALLWLESLSTGREVFYLSHLANTVELWVEGLLRLCVCMLQNLCTSVT